MTGSKTHLVLAFVLAIMVMAVVPLWFILGEVGGGAHVHGGASIPEDWFMGKLRAQQDKYGLDDGSIRMPPGSTVYVLAQQFAFAPGTIRLTFGGLYDFIFYSTDVIHGASLVQSGSLNAVVMPQTTSVLSIRASQLGEITLLCNDYCGPGHHLMKGTIIVE